MRLFQPRFANAFLFLLIGLVARPVSAQVGATTGAIVGTVTDNTKAVLPGVTVTGSGSGLMGTRTAVTDAEGTYRLPALPPGTYTIAFGLAGFSTIKREGIEVGGGFTATVNSEMSPAAVAETVVVTGASPVVDLAATKVTTNYNAEAIASVPGSRDYWAILAQAPGITVNRIDVGGNGALSEQFYVSYGMNTQSRGQVEGMDTAESNAACCEIYYVDFQSFQDAAVNAVGNGAEMGMPGVWTTLISKSGGNTYHGLLYQDYENESMEAHNIDASQLALGVAGGGSVKAVDTNRLQRFHDFNANLGGFVIKDKLWWFGAFRYTTLGLRFVDLTDSVQDTTIPVYTGKLTYNLTSNNKLDVYATRTVKHQDPYISLGAYLPNAIYSSATAQNETFPVGVWKGEYDAVLGKSAVFEIRAGDWYYDFLQEPKAQAVRYEDIGNHNLYGSAYRSDLVRHRYQEHDSLSYFKSGWAGSHDFKFGSEVMLETYDADYTVFNNQVLVLNNGAPSQAYIYQSPALAKNRMFVASEYAQDSWKLNNRLTLNLGLRTDHYRSYVPSQTGPTGQQFNEITGAVWNNLGPRIGAVYALTSDGKTVVKANYGQYWQSPASDFGNRYNPNPRQNYSLYTWTPANPTYVNGLPVFDSSQLGTLIARAGASPNGLPSTTVDPNLLNAFSRQALAYFEREVAPNFGIRTGFVWNGRRQGFGIVNTSQPFSAFNVPVTVTDPGPDGRLGTGDDGQPLQAFNLNAGYLGLPVKNVVQNNPYMDSDYYTWEITANRRQSRRWSLMTSFSETWNHAAVFTIGGASTLPFTPNALINTTDTRNSYKTWAAKINATFDIPWSIRLAPLYRLQSGVPFARTFNANLNYSSGVAIMSEPYESERTPTVNVVDLRTEKIVAVRQTKLHVFFDLYNIFNDNSTQAVTTSSGTAFLRPLNITGPRILRFGARLDF